MVKFIFVLRSMKPDRHLKKISPLFDKYKQTLVAPEASVIKEVCDVIRDVTGHEINVRLVSYSVGSKTVSLSVPSVLKHELLLQKEELLAHLKGRLGVKSAPKAII